MVLVCTYDGYHIVIIISILTEEIDENYAYLFLCKKLKNYLGTYLNSFAVYVLC